MKKILINLALIVIGFIIYFLQSNFFSWFTIAGIKPNLFVIYVLFIGLFGSRSMGIVYGSIIGIFLDLIFKEKIGANLFGLALIGIIATLFDKNFSKDSRITIMFMVFGSTVIFEIVSYFINYILCAWNILNILIIFNINYACKVFYIWYIINIEIEKE